MFVQLCLLSLLIIKQIELALRAHPILLITRNDNRRNWTPLRPVTITYTVFVYTSSATRDLIGLEIVDVRQYLPPK